MPDLFIPLDGRIPSQNALTAPLDGTAVMEIVSPGNNAEGNTYQISLTTLAGYFMGYPYSTTTVIVTGATVGTPYPVRTTDTRVLFNKTVGAASYTACPAASSMDYQQSVLFKDAKGDAAANPITISFASGELCDGLETITITTPYGWVWLTPTPGGGSWYMS